MVSAPPNGVWFSYGRCLIVNMEALNPLGLSKIEANSGYLKRKAEL